MSRRIWPWVAKLQNWRADKENAFPRTCKAIDALRDALALERSVAASWKKNARQKLASHRRPAVAGHKRPADPEGARRTRLHRMSKKVKMLENQLAELKTSKDVRGRVSEEWLVRVILAAPKVSGRALAEAFHLAVGVEGNMVSRATIGNIRAAFLEMWKALIFSTVREFAALQLLDASKRNRALAATGALPAATCANPNFVGMYITHVQDEADLRLLSNDATSRPGLPRRSRSSKVQIHVVSVSMNGQSWTLPQELEAFADKRAITLATSIERLLLKLIAEVVPPQVAHHGSHRRPEIWLSHCIIGDGINTNDAAAKVLWALALQGQFQPVRYFLAVCKCGTHQSALAAKNGVIGRAAATAAAAGGEAKEFEDVTGTAVRLFKYLVPDYYDHFRRSVEQWVHCNLEVFLPGDPGRPQAAADGQPQAARLQALYTDHVIPNDLLQFWIVPAEGGTGKLQMVMKDGEDMAAARERLENECSAFLVKRLLHVDSHPTLTRFFTYRGCVDRMLTMALLNLPQKGLVVQSSARELTQNRLKKVKQFFGKPAACQALRRASLVLQLTAGIETFMSAKPKEGEPPVVVALQQGKAHEILDLRLQRIFGSMHYDPDLHIGAATSALLGTAGDLTARLKQYMLYPYRIVKMCRKWFPATHRHEITRFLQAATEELDVGFSLALQRRALAEDSELLQRAFMLSDAVQEFLEATADALFANSLAAERQAAMKLQGVP